MKNLTLIEFRKNILKQKPVKLSSQQFEELKTLILEDNLMTTEKADLLFEIKKFAKKNLCEEFKPFFIDKISEFLLEAGDSRGEIDSAEGKWLKGKIRLNDSYDSELLINLKDQLGGRLPNYLEKKNRYFQKFEELLYSCRYFSFIAVIGSVLSAIILFFQGFGIILNGLVEYFKDPYEKYEILFERLVSSVDVFLFALVLIIFGVGVYELFIANIDPDDKPSDSRPSWLKITSVDDLKSSLGKVILMVLIVSFFKHALEIASEAWSPLALLYLSIGILFISGALYITHKSTIDNDKDNDKE